MIIYLAIFVAILGDQKSDNPEGQIKGISGTSGVLSTAKLFDGAMPIVSPNGSQVAFRRFVPLASRMSRKGGTFTPLREDIWVRSLVSDQESLVLKNAKVIGWVDDEKLELTNDKVFNLTTGGIEIGASRYSRADATENLLRWHLHEGKSIEFRFHHRVVKDIVSSEKGYLWNSPTFDDFAFELLCARDGDTPIRILGIGNKNSEKMIELETLPYINDNWGHVERHRIMAPSSPWTIDGRLFAMVTSRNLIVFSRRAEKVQELFHVEKCAWSPVFSPCNRFLAYFSGTSKENGRLEDVEVCVHDLEDKSVATFVPKDVQGFGLTLSWTPDGREILLDWYPGSESYSNKAFGEIHKINWPVTASRQQQKKK